MKEIAGKYAAAKVFTDQVEDSAIDQIKELCDQSFTEGCKVRVMPDAHAGAGCVIGFTADLGERVVPNLVGVDIGCSLLVVDLDVHELDYSKFDDAVRKRVPSGRNVHEGRIRKFDDITDLLCYRDLKDAKRMHRAIGTLGGGNHFIALERSEDDGRIRLVIHTGSRNLGKQVAEHYQKLAIGLSCGKGEMMEEQERIIREYKEQGRRSEIQERIKQLHREFQMKSPTVPRDLAYLEGRYRDEYLHDMRLCQEFATLNRRTIAESVIDEVFGKDLSDFEWFETVHNYVDFEDNIIRKGAVSAKVGERFIIPINMRDGSLICIGKGNDDWNQSAPHGAGRLMSRTQAFDTLSVDEFEDTMRSAGIWSSCVGESTLDESPMAYKHMDNILENIDPTADVVTRLVPVYNYKAS